MFLDFKREWREYSAIFEGKGMTYAEYKRQYYKNLHQSVTNNEFIIYKMYYVRGLW